MKKYLILLITLFAFSCGSAQHNGNLDRMVLTKAHEMGKAFVAKDYATLAKFAHPRVVKIEKGEEAMIKKMVKDFAELEGEGVTFLEINFGEPSKIIVVENELQCVIQQQIVMLVPGGKLTATTSLIALSEDQGKNWYFVDAAGNNIRNMKALIPSLSLDLPVIQPADPIFEAFEEEPAAP